MMLVFFINRACLLPPLVAAVWLLLIGRWSGAPVSTMPAVALACAVWLIYVADRKLDARSLGDKASGAHWAVVRYARWYSVAALALLGAMTYACLQTPRPVLLAWTALAVLLVGYFVLVHGVGGADQRKPSLIACFFASACTLPAAVLHGHAPTLVRCGLLFGTLCWLNLALLRRPSDRPVVRRVLADLALLLPAPLLFRP